MQLLSLLKGGGDEAGSGGASGLLGLLGDGYAATPGALPKCQQPHHLQACYPEEGLEERAEGYHTGKRAAYSQNRNRQWRRKPKGNSKG